jgi:hypothetical protein
VAFRGAIELFVSLSPSLLYGNDSEICSEENI